MLEVKYRFDNPLQDVFKSYQPFLSDKLLAVGTIGVILTLAQFFGIYPDYPRIDMMGVSMLFDGRWELAMVPFSVGTALLLELAWFWAIAIFVLLVVVGLLLKWGLITFIERRYRRRG